MNMINYRDLHDEMVNSIDPNKQLTRSDCIKLMSYKGIDISNRLRFVVCDNKNSIFAPERYSYKLYFDCVFTSKRQRLSLFPTTVGYQGL